MKIIIPTFIMITILFILSWLTIIESWEIWLRYNLGSITNTIDEWITFNNPFTNTILKVDIKTNKLEVTANSASKDLQSIEAKVALNYSVDKISVMKLYRDVWSDFKVRIIEPAMNESIKASISKYTAEELITKRELVRGLIIETIKSKMNWKWIIINDVNIVNFEFSKSFNESIENKVTAEQDALAQKNKLEQVKYEAQQQIEKAKAQAESIKIQAQAVTSQWWADYVKLQWINKWDWVLPKTSLWEKTNTLLNLN